MYHLYHNHQLLTNDEEKEWKAQGALLKYGESEEDDEAESVPDLDPETEEEEEELMLPIKRQKTTPPHRRGTPPGHGPSTPDEKRKGVMEEEMDPQDPFKNLIGILSSVRADWEVKHLTLQAIGRLVDAPPDSQLPTKVGDCITDPVEYRRRGRSNPTLD